MNILHVIHSVDPRSGGPSHALRGLVRAQVERGHRVTVVATTAQSAEPWSPTEDFRRRIAADPDFERAEVTLLPAWGRRGLWSRMRFCWESVRPLGNRLAIPKAQPNLVHICGHLSHLATGLEIDTSRVLCPPSSRLLDSVHGTHVQRAYRK